MTYGLPVRLTAIDATPVTSPDGRLTVHLTLTKDGAPTYAVSRDGRPVLRPSRLGLVRDDADFSTGLRRAAPASEPRAIDERYELLTSKRRHNHYQANEVVVPLQSAGGARLDLCFRVSNDGVAFRYVFPEQSDRVHRLTRETTSFHLLPDSRAWVQPMAVAKSGWSETNPSYEEYYERDVPAGTPSTLGAGWVFPALFRSGDTWLLVSEAGLGRDYCGSRLAHESPDGEYSIAFADARETFGDGPALPESTLPWATPWRLIVIGSLRTVVESTLGTDLAAPPAVAVDPTVLEPGKASWSWPLLGDPNTTFDVQKRFIDYAAEMGWRYCLIDALWDTQIGYDKLAELVTYGAGKGVKILVWYNSAGAWNSAPQTPRGKLLTREDRLAEFARLKQLGVAGLKIDFFGGDGQSMIAYYHDLLTDAAPFGFLINFHGATLPRGWQRTYPHLMTMESIRGLEFITFDQANADRAPAHASMLPFTRNVFDPMDFTPVVLDQIRNIERRTTSGFELALAVLFTSGIQHYAEIPEGMAKAPEAVRDLMREVPSVWDDVRFLDGMPGEYVILARRSGTRWYVAGIQAGDTPREVVVDLSGLRAATAATSTRARLITDAAEGGNLAFATSTPDLNAQATLRLTLRPRGGFVLVLE
ncbi:MAG: glycoside hydrolase family 97 catalytic domain-containing protein [Opitutaceae bacterium]|nr:glycoside hydrolase family 97 catalytic domain-containing protein [Opitutaceae bacterium]